MTMPSTAAAENAGSETNPLPLFDTSTQPAEETSNEEVSETTGSSADDSHSRGGANGFMERMAQAQTPEPDPLLDKTDLSAVRGAHNEATITLDAIESIRQKLNEMDGMGNCVAGDFLADSEEDLAKREDRAIRECYFIIIEAINQRYGTRLESRKVFDAAWQQVERESYHGYKTVISLLSKDEIAQSIVNATDGFDLEDAGEKAVVDYFRDEMSSWKDPKIRKSLVELPSYVYFDHISPERLSNSSHESMQALAGALWLFDCGEAKRPNFFMRDLASYGCRPDTTEKLTEPVKQLEKVDALKIHKNGKVKVYFTEPKHTRAFAQMFGLE